MKKYAEGGMSADEEADLQALKNLKQGDYDVGGPKRRRGPRANDEDMSVGKRLKATAYKALNKIGSIPFDLAEYVESKTTKNPENRVIKKNVGDVKRRLDAEKERGAYFKKGGAVKSSASKRADGCAVKGKTRGKFV
jgi:hypothetical protein